jgi:hypothetical protein
MKLFSNIPAEDCELLNMDVRVTAPTDLLVSHVLVPPACARCGNVLCCVATCFSAARASGPLR